MIAFATSVASARVGRGDEIIDSSILRRRNDGLRSAICARDQILLYQRHLFERDLDAEIAARDHDAVGHGHDRIDRVERFVLFDLRDDRYVLAAFRNEALDPRHVFGRLHEGHRDPIDVLRNAESEVLEIAIGDGRDRERSVGIVDALLTAQFAADFDARFDPVVRRRNDAQLDRAVRKIDRPARFNVAR